MDNPTNNQIHIQDYIVRSDSEKHNPIGECNQIDADESTQSTRLYQFISTLIENVSQTHQKNHCIGTDLAIKKGSENHLSRLITNEFMFYTKKRLESDDFTLLLDKILDLAKKQPENLHLILSSFAVKALNTKTMNVVIFITCGKNPRVELIVKNNPSFIDPLYYEETYGIRTHFDNINVNIDKEDVFPALITHGKEYRFSYNNIFEIVTLGGAKKIMAFELCLDHAYALAKTKCTEYIESGLTYPLRIFPNQISQVISSNTIGLEKDKMLEENATHADPDIPPYKCKPSSNIIKEKHIISSFGNKSLNCILMNSTPCSKLPKNLLTQVDNYNERKYVFVHPANHTFPERFNNTLVRGYQLFSEGLNDAANTINRFYHNIVDNYPKKRKIPLEDNEHSSPKKRKKTGL